MPADPLALARDLIRCPSVTPSEGGALSLLERVLGKAGFATHRLTFSEPGFADVENLYARVGDASPNLVFAGHTDVVPPGEEAAWSHPPFGAEVKEGVLYGRGAADMKGAVACFVAAALDYLEGARGEPRCSISLLITGDEEGVAVNGMVKLLQWAAARGERFDHCILGEPTNPRALGEMMKIGRRGSLNGALIVSGTQGHVAYPQLADNPIRGIVALMSALMSEPLDSGSEHFEPSNLEFTSVDVGNKTENLIPAQARARFNIRFNDRHSQASLRALLEQRCAKAASGRIRYCLTFDPSNADVFITRPGSFTDLVSGAVEDVTGHKPELSTTGGTSDARFIKDYCPVVEFGLANSTMHKIDEHVAIEDLVRLTAIYRRLIERYFG